MTEEELDRVRGLLYEYVFPTVGDGYRDAVMNELTTMGLNKEAKWVLYVCERLAASLIADVILKIKEE